MCKLLAFIISTLLSTTLIAQDAGVSLSQNESDFPTESLAAWDAAFPDQNVGFFHVYTDPVIDPNEVYLLRGQVIGGYETALLPNKIQRLANRMEATLYAAAAVRDGQGGKLYLVRMEGADQDRIEMFQIDDAVVKHVQTLAYRQCEGNDCRQIDSFLTDVDGDTEFEIMQIFRVQKDGETRRSNRVMYDYHERSGKWKKAKMVNAPWASTEFFDPTDDDQ
ncbi:hypothetical protein [Lewinella sp. W8]|uniref:hypothetical protein n=1 Tax=Lewinella sp. W8 TaxID=2528208 RepID=UPI00106788B5|nr:hypothetical protein [Lewinella sp. W8]MTB52625.1 hypothetical protein [Lewinella sp. W8]